MEVWFLGEYQSMKHNHMDNNPSWLEVMCFITLFQFLIWDGCKFETRLASDV